MRSGKSTVTATPRRAINLQEATPTKAEKGSKMGHEDLMACWNFGFYSWTAEAEPVAETSKERANRSSGERVVGNWRHSGVNGDLLVVGMGGGRVEMRRKLLKVRNKRNSASGWLLDGPAGGFFLPTYRMVGRSVQHEVRLL